MHVDTRPATRHWPGESAATQGRAASSGPRRAATTTIAGKYKVLRSVGFGGMGHVVEAVHVPTGQHVALKFLLPEGLANAEALERFAREARAALSLRSEHVAHIYDVGEHQGAPFIAMELLEGEDVSALVERAGRLPWRTAVRFAMEACDAIAEAHELGIVHRDLKGKNLFVARSGETWTLKVLDFGIAKLESGGDPTITKTAVALGSPHYMAPEQMMSARDADARSDVWAIGVCLYEMLTGQLPFDARNLPRLFGKVMNEDPRGIREQYPDVPEAVEAVVMKCLAKDRGKRFPDAHAIGVALARAVTPRQPFLPARDYTLAIRVAAFTVAAVIGAGLALLALR